MNLGGYRLGSFLVIGLTMRQSETVPGTNTFPDNLSSRALTAERLILKLRFQIQVRGIDYIIIQPVNFLSLDYILIIMKPDLYPNQIPDLMNELGNFDKYFLNY